MKHWTRRDLTILPLDEADCLVLACDSVAGVGNKEFDSFHCDPFFVGKFAARVALMEVLSAGADPVALINGTACEMHPSGARILDGVQAELKQAALADIALTGSTEENFFSKMTALTVTVIGRVAQEKLKFASAQAQDKILLFGRPRVGEEVALLDPGLYAEIAYLRETTGVREIVPVGSKGIAYEALTFTHGLDLQLAFHECGVDYQKSAGPATCLLALCQAESAAEICARWDEARIVASVLAL